MPRVTASKYLVTAGWDDVPHLTEARKAQMIAGTMPYLRDARSKGTPSLGAGAIYPISESEFVIPPMPIPEFWPKGYALDVGWKKTAALWGAWDRTSDIIYLYTDHYRGEAQPSVHASAIKARGDWMHGVIDPASRGRSQSDGQKLIELYGELGLDLSKANNQVEAGLYRVWERLSTGRLKVFSSMHNFLNEYRLYRRNEKGAIVKEHDHLMDCLRYIVASFEEKFTVRPVQQRFTNHDDSGDNYAGY